MNDSALFILIKKVFASRLRKAKEKKLKSHERDLERHQHEQTDNKSLPKFKIDTHYRPLSSDNPSDHAEPVRVKIIEGISHGFFQMVIISM